MECIAIMFRIASCRVGERQTLSPASLREGAVETSFRHGLWSRQGIVAGAIRKAYLSHFDPGGCCS